MATLGDIIENVRVRLDELSYVNFNDTQLITWINQGAKDVARRCEVLSDRAEIPTVANTQEYAAPVDLIRAHRVEWYTASNTTHYTLQYRDFNTLDEIWLGGQTIGTGIPAVYSMWGFPPNLKIVIYPTPAATGVLKIYYYRLPATVEDTSATVEIPSGWEDVIEHYCEYMALRKDRDSRWQEAKGLYEEALGALYDTTRRWVDQPGTFVTGTGNHVPAWLSGAGGWGDF